MTKQVNTCCLGILVYNVSKNINTIYTLLQKYNSNGSYVCQIEYINIDKAIHVQIIVLSKILLTFKK